MKRMQDIEHVVERSEKKLAGRGRILVRPSGTEPKIRVMVEGKDPKLIKRISSDVTRTIKKIIS